MPGGQNGREWEGGHQQETFWQHHLQDGKQIHHKTKSQSLLQYPVWAGKGQGDASKRITTLLQFKHKESFLKLLERGGGRERGKSTFIQLQVAPDYCCCLLSLNVYGYIRFTSRWVTSEWIFQWWLGSGGQTLNENQSLPFKLANRAVFIK